MAARLAAREAATGRRGATREPPPVGGGGSQRLGAGRGDAACGPAGTCSHVRFVAAARVMESETAENCATRLHGRTWYEWLGAYSTSQYHLTTLYCGGRARTKARSPDRDRLFRHYYTIVLTPVRPRSQY
eukprot:5424574-Prymnesium_polylepis.5